MTAEIDQAIKQRYLHHQDLKLRMNGLRQKWDDHDRRMGNLPPIIKPILNFFDGMRGLEGNDKYLSWVQERHRVYREIIDLIKRNPGIYELTHLRYHAYTARDLGLTEFDYGFQFSLDGKPLGEPFDGPVRFFSNGIMARRAEGETALIEIRENEPPILHFPEGLALIITKYKAVTEIDLSPDEPEKVYAGWQPKVTYEPKAIKVSEDAVIPWKSSVEEVEVFTDTVEVANLKFR